MAFMAFVPQEIFSKALCNTAALGKGWGETCALCAKGSYMEGPDCHGPDIPEEFTL